MSAKTLRNQLLAAIAMTLVAAIALGSSTFAWFSLNNTVRVTGMEVTTKVGDSLLIAPTDSASNTSVSDADAFTTGLHQVVSGKLQPSSTTTAADAKYWYSYDAKADGSRASDITLVNYSHVENNTITPVEGGEDYKAYVDYIFQLKAMNAKSLPQYLNLTKINLTYKNTGDTTKVTNAFRIAIFAQDEATAATTYNTRSVDAEKIYKTADAEYFDDTAVDSVSTKAAVARLVDGTTVEGWNKEIPSGQTKFYQVTVRLWLEGEDTDCYSTKFIDLKDNWNLELEFKLESSKTSGASVTGIATNITSAVRAVVALSDTTITLTRTLETDDSVASIKWYTVGSDTPVATSGDTYTITDTSTTASYYAVVTTNRGTQYKSNVVTYTAPAVGP